MTDKENTAAEFDQFFKRDLVFRDVDFKDAAAFFRWISDTLEKLDYVQPTFYKAITEREANYPTGLLTASTGAAIPHTDPANIRKPFIAVVRPKNPIAFSPMGGSPDDEKIQAKIIFVLGVMRNGLQVKVLQKLMSLLSDRTVMEQLLMSEDDGQILEMIKSSFKETQIQ